MTDRTPTRRDVLHHAAASAAAAGVGLLASAAPAPAADVGGARPATAPATRLATRPAKAADPVGIGVIGTGGRGTELAVAFARNAGAVVKVVCDVDAKLAAAAAKAVGQHQDREPAVVADLRRVLDDPAVDAVVIAAPDHWHAIVGILACQAGKHAYVEKPCSHNPLEGELLVAAARKHGRLVQHGTQRRSWPGVIEAIGRVRAGDIGTVRLSRGWYNNTRGETGRRTPAAVPPGLDWDLWQGPAPRRPFATNVVPYKWHWYWDWGTGELGNNGVHALDVCRWGLGVGHPRRVTAGGGRYHFADDQETPDTLSVTFDYGDKAIFWEGRSCHPRGFESSGFGVAFYGDKGTLVVDGGGYKILDPKGKEVEKPVAGDAGNDAHLDNFVQAIRGKAKLAAEIEEGHKSTLVCHLGNIAYRTGRTLDCDPATGRIVGNVEAQKLWGRAYEPGWEPKG